MTGSNIKVTSSNPTNLIGFELNIHDYEGIEWMIMYGYLIIICMT